MKCYCCDRILSDYEATLRRRDNGEFVDICTKCLRDIPIETIGREDLNKKDIDETEYFPEDESHYMGNFDLGPMWLDEAPPED